VAIQRRIFLGLGAAALAMHARRGRAAPHRTLALLFDSLVSPFWVAALERFQRRLAARGWSALQAVSNMDDNRQYTQVQSMIQRGVDGIVIVHTDDNAVIPAIRAANAAGVPMVHFNRAPAPSDAYSVAVVADNRKLMDDTVTALIERVRRSQQPCRAAILLGNLGDANGANRRDGFDDAIARAGRQIEVVARIPTEWNADKAFAGLSNALRAHPEINFLVTSSDFLTPQIEQVLRLADKWHPRGTLGHVNLAGFDGDDNGYAQLAAGYFDVDGVQNLDYEVTLTLNALEQMWNGARPARILLDPGFVIDVDNLATQRDRMWGYELWKSKAAVSAATPGTVAPTTSGVGDASRMTTPPNVPPPSSALSAATSPGTVGSILLTSLAAFAVAMFSWRTAHDVILAMLPLAILTGGQLLVLLIGQIDLSMPAVMALTSVIGATAMTHHSGSAGGAGRTVAGVLAFLAVGAALGFFNGLCVALLRVPSFILTLAVLMSGEGAAIWYASTVSGTVSIGGLPADFRSLGYGTIGAIPIALIVTVIVLLVIHLILSRTVTGRRLYALGHNAAVARLCGAPINILTVATFTASALCASLASIIYTSRLETGVPTLGHDMLLDMVGAAVIGGVSLFGGRGSIWSVLVGVAFLCILDKSLQLLGLSLFIVLAVKGVAILVAAILDLLRSRRTLRA
jgi:ribose/xylose/arabinose/galactoside ABC-type transport system permease subunit/ABC-type sugar transport system substrate-binding protein